MNRTLDRLTVLLMSPWAWLTPRARLYKGAAWTVALLLILAMVDQAFVLPKIEGRLGVVSLGGALAIVSWMFGRWCDDEALDLPREWIASRPRG